MLCRCCGEGEWANACFCRPFGVRYTPLFVGPTQDKHSSLYTESRTYWLTDLLTHQKTTTAECAGSPTCTPQNSQTHQLTNLQTHQLISSAPHQLCIPSTRHLKNLHVHHVINSSRHPHENMQTNKLVTTATPQLLTPSTRVLTNSSTYQLTNSSTQNLKKVIFVLQYRSDFYSVLARMLVKKWAKSHYF